MSKILIPVLAIAAIGSGIFAVVKMQESTDLRGQLAGLNDRVTAQEKSLTDALNGLKTANDELASLRENNERLKRERDEARAQGRGVTATGSPSQPATGGDQRGDMRAMLQGFARQMDDPEVRKMMKSNQQRMIAGAYDSLFKQLNLSEEETKLVAELLADRNMAALDQGRKLLNGKTDEASMDAVRKEITATKAESDEKLKGMLGEDKFKELTTFEQTVGDQRALDGFARTFERKNMPMQPEQRDTLAKIMKEERLKNPSNEIPDLGGGPGMGVLMSETQVKAQQEQEKSYQANVLSRAREAGLSPDQVNALRDSFEERNERRNMGRVWGRAFLGGGR